MSGLYFGSGIDDGFDRDLAKMNVKLNGLSKNVKKQSGVMNSAFKTVTKTVGGLVSVMAVGAAGKELISFSKELETALTEVGTISSEVTDNFDQYKDAILELSTTSASSAKTLTNAFYDIVSAGYDGSAGLELLAAAEKASTAGFVEIGTAADGLTTVLNAWGKSADQAASVSDVFFKTVEKGKTTFPELGANIAQVAPVAASLGVSFEEVSGAAATLTKQGTPTAQAFTQIRSSLLAMNKVLGDGWADTMTYQDGLLEIQKRANGSTNELRNMLGRVEAVNAVLGLTGKNAQVAASDLAAMNESLGATAIAADKVTATTEQQVKILKNNILAALEPLGDSIKDVIGDLAKNLNEAFESGNIQKYAKILAKLTKAFITYKVSVVAMNQVNKLRKNILLQDIKLTRTQRLIYLKTGKTISKSTLAMATANKTAVKSFKALGTAFKANPVGLLITGLTLVIPLIKRFTDKTNEAAEAQEELNDQINSSDLVKGLNTIEKRLSALTTLNKRQLQELITDIQDQIKAEENYTAKLDQELNTREKSIYKEADVRELLAKTITEGYKLSAKERLQIDLFEANKSLNNIKKSNKDRIKELENYLKTVSETLKNYPKDEGEENESSELGILEKVSQKIEELQEQRKQATEDELFSINQRIKGLQNYLDELQKVGTEYSKLNKLKSTWEQRETKEPTIVTPKTTGGKSKTVNTDEISNAFSQITSEFSNLGDGIANQLADLSTNTVKAFETLNNESSSTSEQISGIISLVMVAGQILKDIVNTSYTDAVNDQIAINKGIANQIEGQKAINDLIRERRELELDSSAFIDADYRDQYNLSLQKLNDSEKIVNDSISSLSENLVLTAEGEGEAFFGLIKSSEKFSFTLDEILHKSDTLSGVDFGIFNTTFLDPLDIFGGAQSGTAYKDALKKVEKAFNNALKSMGKTAGDMANFSNEQWTEFYTILDEGGYIADEGSKALIESMKEAQQAYTEALEEMKSIISNIAGSLGDALGDSIVNAVANGTDALDEFESSLNDVFLQMAKAEMNKLFFKGLFDELQEEMEASMAGGDQDWQDDLLRFYDKLPNSISGAENFMRQFDEQLKDLGFEGVSGDVTSDQSTAGQIAQSITEETGTILAGHFGAVRLSNERIANYSEESLDLAVQNLVTLNKIKENTDYLPEIAENTKKTVQKLGGI